MEAGVRIRERYLSTNTYHPIVSHEVKGKAMDFMAHFDELDLIMQDELGDEDDWMFESDEIDHEPGGHLLKGAIDLFTDQFLVVPSTQMQGDVSVAMSQAIKVALNQTVRSLPLVPKVLIVGSGFGNDVRRVLMALGHSGRFESHVTCVEPNEDRITKSKEENPTVKHIMGYFNDAYEYLLDSGPYDLIVCTMSTQFIIGRVNPKVDDFGALLAKGGRFVGTFFDHDSYFSMMPAVMREVGSAILVGPRAQSVGTVLGTHTTRIYGKVFEDPYVNGRILQEFCHTHMLGYEYYRGVSALKRFGDHTLARSVKSKSLTASLVSLVIIFHHEYIPVPTPLFFGGDFVAPSEVVFPPAYALSLGESLHHRPGTFAVAVKRDGIREYWTLDRRGLITPHHKFRCPYISEALCLQVEVCGSLTYIVDAKLKSWVGLPIPFMRRYELANSVVSFIGSVVPCVVNEFWIPQNESEIMYMMIKLKGTEGAVIAPLANYHGDRSEIRYSKYRYTIDIKKGDKIVEIDAHTKEFIRERPDKTDPNPPSVIKLITKAPPLNEVFRVLLLNASNVPLPDDLWKMLEAADPTLVKWSPSALVRLLKYRACLTFPQSEKLSMVISDAIEIVKNATYLDKIDDQAFSVLGEGEFEI